jgi:two-component system, sensor histidine kinase YesM
MRKTVIRRKFFKKEIRKTFIVYALIPTILLSSIFYTILFGYSRMLIKNRNDDNNKAVSTMLEKEIDRYRQKIIDMNNSPVIRSLFAADADKTPTYETMYRFSNERVIKTYFYIFDAYGRIIISNAWGIANASGRTLSGTGMLSRLTQNPDDVSIAVNHANQRQWSGRILSVGRALTDTNKRILGFVLFDMYEDDITSAIKWNREDLLVITDRYNNAIMSTNNVVVDVMGKFKPVEYAANYTEIGKTRYFLIQRNVADGNIIVNTLSSLTFINRLYINGMIMIVVIFLIMGICIILMSRRFAEIKGKSLDELLRAIKQVQDGNLDSFVDIRSNDEFEMLGSYYNEMIVKLKDLMRLNFEQTRQNKISELQQLEAQFNPHFLFNTLEMIRYLIKDDPAAASKTIVNMAQLLRYSIDYEKDFVVLEDDIRYITNYFNIQKMRFNQRFEYNIDIDAGAMKCLIPKLIIQPLVENSIKYGFKGKDRLAVTVSASLNDMVLVLSVTDNGAGIDSETLAEIRALLQKEKNTSRHIGLYNVQKRIALLYGSEYTVKISSECNRITKITVELPVHYSDSTVNVSDKGIQLC